MQASNLLPIEDLEVADLAEDRSYPYAWLYA